MIPQRRGGGVLSYFGMVGRFPGGPWFFFFFQSDWVPILPLQNPIDPLFLQEKLVCIYHI